MVLEGRLWVRLTGRRALVDYMKFRHYTVRGLAADVDRITAKAGEPTSSRAVIGHLRSGERTTCRPSTAAAIESCLQAPPGSLFVAQVSPVSRPYKTAA